MPRRHWTFRAGAMLAVLLAAAIWGHRQPLADIVANAVRDDEQSHILLVPLIAAWLVWLRRSRLRYITHSPSLIGPLLVALGWVASWWGFMSGTQVAWHGGALVSIVGAIISVTGTEVVRQFAPAFASLVFALPVPGLLRQGIAIPLQGIATTVTHSMLELLGVGATRTGNVLILNGEQVAVGEACNGMRMVFALTLVVFAFAFSTPLRLRTRILLLVFSPVTALACNVVRLVPTSLFYGYGDPASAQSFHDLAGWVMLPVALMLLLGLLRTLRWMELPVTSYRLVTP